MPVTLLKSVWESGNLLFKRRDTGATVATIKEAGIFSIENRLMNTEAKIGATAGWTLGGGAVDTGMMAICPASQTASTLIVPITGLKVGETITGFTVNGQVESAGNTATLDADLRRMTAIATGSTDASVGAITQVSATADAIVNATKSGLSEVVAETEGFYVLLTATTAASTDLELLNIKVTVSAA